jgi:tetratricopeptide (TPR) repeat protein
VPRGPVERLAGAAWALGFYVQKAYLPMGLAFVYPRWPIEPESPLFLVPLGVAAVAAAAGWRLRASRARPVVLALAYQTVTVLPVLGLVEIAYFSVGPVSNHLQYLALLGPCALGGAALAAASARWPRASRMAAVQVLGLGASTLSRASAFKDDVTLWQRAAGDAPGASFAHERLAKELAERGRREEALASLIEVARLARDPAARCSALSYWHVYRGEYDAAIANAREAVRLKPVPPFRRDLGLLLVVTGHTAEALGIFQQLVLEYPRVAEYRYWLGRALEGEGDGGGTPDGRASRRPG